VAAIIFRRIDVIPPPPEQANAEFHLSIQRARKRRISSICRNSRSGGGRRRLSFERLLEMLLFIGLSYIKPAEALHCRRRMLAKREDRVYCKWRRHEGPNVSSYLEFLIVPLSYVWWGCIAYTGGAQPGCKLILKHTFPTLTISVLCSHHQLQSLGSHLVVASACRVSQEEAIAQHGDRIT